MYLAAAAPDYEQLATYMYYTGKVDEILETDYSKYIRTHEQAQKAQAAARGITHEQWIQERCEKIRREKIDDLREMLGYDRLAEDIKPEEAKLQDRNKSIRSHYDDLRAKLDEYKREVRRKEEAGIPIDENQETVVNEQTGKIDIRALDRTISREQLKRRQVKQDGQE